MKVGFLVLIFCALIQPTVAKRPFQSNATLHPSNGSAYVMGGIPKQFTIGLFAFSSRCYGMKFKVVGSPVGCSPPKLTVVIPSTPPFNETTFNVTGNGTANLTIPLLLEYIPPVKDTDIIFSSIANNFYLDDVFRAVTLTVDPSCMAPKAAWTVQWEVMYVNATVSWDIGIILSVTTPSLPYEKAKKTPACVLGSVKGTISKQMLVIQNAQVNDYLTANMLRGLWTNNEGWVCGKGKNGTFTWGCAGCSGSGCYPMEGQPFNYTRWRDGEPRLPDGCVYFRDGWWETRSCDDNGTAFCATYSDDTIPMYGYVTMMSPPFVVTRLSFDALTSTIAVRDTPWSQRPLVGIEDSFSCCVSNVSRVDNYTLRVNVSHCDVPVTVLDNITAYLADGVRLSHDNGSDAFMMPCPPVPPPVTPTVMATTTPTASPPPDIPSSEAQALLQNSYFTSVTAFITPSAMTTVQALAMVGSMACASPAMSKLTKDTEWTLSPLHAWFGPIGSTTPRASMALWNVVLLAVIFGAHSAVTAALAGFRRVPFSEACTTTRYPNLSIRASGILVQATVFLFVKHWGEDSNAVSHLAAIAALLSIPCGLLGSCVYWFYRGPICTFEEYRSEGWGTAVSFLRAWLFPRGRWRPKECTRLFGAFFSSFMPRTPRARVISLLYSIGLAVLCAIDVGPGAACRGVLWCIMLMMIFLGGYYAFLRPHRTQSVSVMRALKLGVQGSLVATFLGDTTSGGNIAAVTLMALNYADAAAVLITKIWEKIEKRRLKKEAKSASKSADTLLCQEMLSVDTRRADALAGTEGVIDRSLPASPTLPTHHSPSNSVAVPLPSGDRGRRVAAKNVAHRPLPMIEL